MAGKKKEMITEKPLLEKERTTIYLDVNKIGAIKYMAFMQSTTQTDIIDTSLTEYIEKWEKKNGPIPKR